MSDTPPLDGGRWIDISIPLDESTPIFEGDPTFHLERAFSIEGGAVANVSRLEMGVHTGTHLDAPIHFIDGAPHSQSIPLEAGIGPAWVADATGHVGHRISAAELAALEIPAGTTRLLLKTRNSGLWDQPGFQSSFVGSGRGCGRGAGGTRHAARRHRLPERRPVRRPDRHAPGAALGRRRDPRRHRPQRGRARARSTCSACRSG